MKELSCGIVIFNKSNEVLLAHPTNSPWNRWNIPKGHIYDGESTKECALRETLEETSLDFSKYKLKDLGLFPYLKNKDLYLYQVDNVDYSIKKYKCTSYVDGKNFLEMDKFVYINQKDLNKYLSKVLFDIINPLF